MRSECPNPGEAPGRAAVCLLSVRATVSTNSGQLAGLIFRVEPGAAPPPPPEDGAPLPCLWKMDKKAVVGVAFLLGFSNKIRD